jgi:hypothetical protein
MSALTLYEIAAEYRDQAEKLADLDLPPEVVADTLESLSGDLEVKASNVIMFARNLEALAAQIKEAEAAMAARRKALENRSASLRDYCLRNMQACNISKIEGPMFRIAIRTNPASVEVFQPELVPADYMREIPATQEPDKKLIAQALKEGFDVPGAKLVTDKVRLEVK